MKRSLMRLLYRRVKPRMDITSYIEPGEAKVMPDDRSVEGLNVPEVVMEHGRPARGILTIAPVGPSIVKTAREAHRLQEVRGALRQCVWVHNLREGVCLLHR